MDKHQEFRQQVRQWLRDNCPVSMRTPAAEDEQIWGGRHIEFQSREQQQWFERMRDKGWFAPDWPIEYGGGGLDRKQAAILNQEMTRLQCRPPQLNLGIWMLGPVLLEFGSEAQKQEHLPRMARGEIRWCQGFSEPNAGSDLAGLQMKAESDGDDYIVNGAKIWTSYANKSDWIYALVRTDPKAAKHDGISLLLIDMTSPGIEAKPIELISGESHFCEVFFENVRVPKANLVGEVNGGWSVAKRLMQHERAAIANFGGESESPYVLHQLAKEYIGEHQGRIADPVIRDQVVSIDINEKAFALTLRRTMEEAKQGAGNGAATSIFKYCSTEQQKQKGELLLKILGNRALGWEGDDYSDQELAITRDWLQSKTLSIGGGTSEIQLNIIAKRVLGLPA
ncbi:acyl-CoA dehydrogenase [Pseudomaricurvus alkylphenolicus]|uniref:acyl-CoA dehydrogenase family protein n=1 Tax=Pseudomaricurvus alkylphenolicus TaxID=1306991 RepID=UPI00141FCA27|nr:acyl-CoA dehydrogenase family protein [Pseudomaricurvus alkylphenolicus]NIB41029.1 acyl-CoA dehydrogenase [Pseudomaricurvus alkylphenolicus]